MTSLREPDRLLRGLAPPKAPPGLRQRTIAAASSALAQGGREPGFWTRIWTSRAFRLSWSATIVALLLAHLGLSVRSTLRSGGGSAGPPFLVVRKAHDGELAHLVELAPLRAHTYSVLALPAERRSDHDH